MLGPGAWLVIMRQALNRQKLVEKQIKERDKYQEKVGKNGIEIENLNREIRERIPKLR